MTFTIPFIIIIYQCVFSGISCSITSDLHILCTAAERGRSLSAFGILAEESEQQHLVYVAIFTLLLAVAVLRGSEQGPFLYIMQDLFF